MSRQDTTLLTRSTVLDAFSLLLLEKFPFPEEFEDLSYSKEFVWIGRECGPLMFHLRVKSTNEYGCHELLKRLSVHSFDVSDMNVCCFSHSSQTLAIISVAIGSK